jgi:S-DNA-T family DNA segregation ATPase FtsK/SpoIIIE
VVLAAAAGLTCVLTADRAVPGGRLAGVARHRLVLPLPDRADYAVAGVPLAAVPSVRPPGRALLGEEAAECQLVLPQPFPSSTPPAAGTGRRRGPLEIARLDADPLVDGGPALEAGTSLAVTVGPGGDEGDPLTVALARTGGLLVVGPPGSGRTSTLDALVGDLTASGVAVLHLRGALAAAGQEPGADDADLADPTGVADWLDRHRGAPSVVVVDDLGAAGSAPALASLPQLGAAGGVALLVATTPPDLATWFQGPVAALRRARGGLLLCPGPGDADVLGVRLPRTPVPVRPGSGWLVQAGTAQRVQVARRRVRPAGQSSSSAGPISCVAYQASS